jgi:8-oxo-dGTP pyrophosphatase MutT (NUDIX family)
MEKKFVANKALLVNADGKILFMRDAGRGDHANSKGEWHVPGGRMEHGETAQQALAREVLEETGIAIDPAQARPVHVDLWGVGGDKINEPIIGIFYVVSVGTADVVLSDEHTEYAWFGVDEALKETEGVQARAVEAYRAIKS